jgi:hypothetical protein
VLLWFVAKPVNFRQQKRQKEAARKERQAERMTRRGERPADEQKPDAPATATAPADKIVETTS